MKLNKRERRAQQLLAHYQTCERLAKALGAKNPDGKKISVALLKIERTAHEGATAHCNGEKFTDRMSGGQYDFNADETAWEAFSEAITGRVVRLFGKLPPGRDARGYALKIDNESPEGRALIEAVGLHKDWGGYGILSPEIDGGAA